MSSQHEATAIRSALVAMRDDHDPRWQEVAKLMLTAGVDLWAHGPLHCPDGCHECDDVLWMQYVRRAADIADAYLTSPVPSVPDTQKD